MTARDGYWYCVDCPNRVRDARSLRCRRCRDAAQRIGVTALTGAERQRRYMDSKAPNRSGPKVTDLDDLLAVCWCGAHMDRVPAETIRQGRTWSCGARNCKEAAA